MKTKNIFLIIATATTLLSSCNSQNKGYTAPLHAFSVSKNSAVYFAESNLQYNPQENHWKFADNAYDSLGDNNNNISPDYDGYIDLFGWGMPANPTFNEIDDTLYGDGANEISGTQRDYGIYLKDQIGDGYRMFTHTEIHYMLMFRKNAEKLFGYGSIVGNKGLFILPDDFKLPNGLNFVPSTEDGFENQYDWYWTNGTADNYNNNSYTIEDWNKLRDAGVVFLPCTGMRYGDATDHVGLSGHYWTSNHYGREFANCLCLFEHDLFLEGNFNRSCGLAIRLVKDAK